MPCNVCQNPTLCTERCQAYAEQLEACSKSGQMTAAEVSAHVEAGEMPKHPDCAQECQQAVDYGVWPERSCSPRCVWLSRAAPKWEAGEMEAAKGDATPLPTHPQQEKQS